MNKLRFLIAFLLSCSIIEWDSSAQPSFPPATQAEVDAGIIRTKFVSPATLNAWGGGTTSTGSITAAFATNVARYFSSNTVFVVSGTNILVETTYGNDKTTNKVNLIGASSGIPAPPFASVQFNSNGVLQGSAGFIYTNGQVRVEDIVVAGQGVEITAGSLVLNGGATALASWANLGNIRWPSSGVVRFENESSLNMNRIQLGGDTEAFPAIGRTNGDVIILGANGKFKSGDATNKLRAPAVFIANDGGMGTPLLRLENPLNAIGWDLEINSHAETYILGLGFNDATYAMVWELNGNVGIGITNPTVRLDVQGRFMSRSNVYFPNIASNATPVAFLATDSQGEVYKTAVPAGGDGQSSSMVLSNLVGTVGGNVTNVVSLSTSNSTSKPLTNSYTSGVLTVFGLEGGSGVTIAPNGSNLVISSSASAVAPPISSVQFNSNGVQQGSSSLVFTNGLFGIGTATPGTLLTLGGTPTISVDTSDGSDTKQLLLNAGGAGSVNRGAMLEINGNEQSSLPGDLSLYAGNVSGGDISFLTTPYGAAQTVIFKATTGNFGIGTNVPFSKLDVVGGIRSHIVTASRMAAFHTDKTLTNGATTVAMLDNFFAMGITNIVAADANIVIRTNAGSLTISNSAAGSGTFAAGNSNQIPFINGPQTGYQYAGYSSITNPGFGFSPSGPQAGYGGLMVFANESHGLVTIGHPNPASDLATFATAFAVSNRYNGTGFKQEMSKYDAVDVGSGSDPTSTFVTYRTWSGTTPTIAAEVRKDGQMTLRGGTLYPTNTPALPTAVELGVGGYWVGVSNNAAGSKLVTMWSTDGTTAFIKVLAP